MKTPPLPLELDGELQVYGETVNATVFANSGVVRVQLLFKERGLKSLLLCLPKRKQRVRMSAYLADLCQTHCIQIEVKINEEVVAALSPNATPSVWTRVLAWMIGSGAFVIFPMAAIRHLASTR